MDGRVERRISLYFVRGVLASPLSKGLWAGRILLILTDPEKDNDGLSSAPLQKTPCQNFFW
jgi:hypothetical protein